MKQFFIIINAVILCLIFLAQQSIAESRVEQFLDEDHIESYSGISFSVNRPTKPATFCFGTSDYTWDRNVLIGQILKVGADDIRLWYTGTDSSVVTSSCYATSTDGDSFTKPNLGIVSYGGNTNNNIFKTPEYSPSVQYDSKNGGYYVIKIDVTPGISYTQLRESFDGYTLQPIIRTLNTTGDEEGYAIIKFNNAWLSYYHVFEDYPTSLDLRSIGVYLSDTDMPGGTYTNQGLILHYNSIDDQKYSVTATVDNDIIFLFVDRFNKTSDRVEAIELYISRDGINLTLKDANWMVAGSEETDWDYGMIFGYQLIQMDNVWRFYYSGSLNPHAGPFPRESRLAYATIGYRRIGQVATTGDITTTLLPKYHGDLFVNCNATGGYLKAELLDSSDNVISGYAQADFNSITSDTYSTECTWNGRSILKNQDVKIKFYLSNAYLYSYEVEPAGPEAITGVGGVSTIGEGGTVILGN